VAIDRRSRSVHLAVKDDETEASAKAFLGEALAAFPFRVTHVLTDRGSCFTADGFERACRALGVEHRKTRPYTPRTNGMVERFNGRVQREVLGITVAGHRDLERLLAGFSSAYNARRQRVLDGRSPEDVVRERLRRDTSLANPAYRPPADPCVLPRAMLVVERAKDVSQRTIRADDAAPPTAAALADAASLAPDGGRGARHSGAPWRRLGLRADRGHSWRTTGLGRVTPPAVQPPLTSASGRPGCSGRGPLTGEEERDQIGEREARAHRQDGRLHFEQTLAGDPERGHHHKQAVGVDH
jgi:hypothetical protein